MRRVFSGRSSFKSSDVIGLYILSIIGSMLLFLAMSFASVVLKRLFG